MKGIKNEKAKRIAMNSRKQLELIGIDKSIPPSIMSMLDHNRSLLARVQKELQEEQLTLVEQTKFGTKEYVNPKFTILLNTQKLITDTLKSAVSIADIVETKRFRPIDESLEHYKGGVELSFTDYSADEEVEEKEKELTTKEKIELLKEQKRAENKKK